MCKVEPKAWYLISKEDAGRIRRDLRLAQRTGKFTQVHDFCGDALHTLDAGLNTTDAVPDDWREDVLPAEKPSSSVQAIGRIGYPEEGADEETRA
jgi:hypothetical protein